MVYFKSYNVCQQKAGSGGTDAFHRLLEVASSRELRRRMSSSGGHPCSWFKFQNILIEASENLKVKL
ncbi:hypothetical protein V6N13_087663 [Hibiscus sabdariffa]